MKVENTRRVGGLIILVVLIMQVITAEAFAAYQWMNGNFSYTYTINCVSQIQGSPYSEPLTMEYVGFGADPTIPPKVGDIYYGKIVVSTPGNPCAGPYVHVEVGLPKYTEFAVDAAHPIECWTERPAVVQGDSVDPYHQITDGSCPTQPSMGIYGTGFYSLDSTQGPWPLATRRILSIFFPLRSSAPLLGIAGSQTLLVGAIQGIDGYNTWDGAQAGWNGVSAPSSGTYQWVTVANHTPTFTTHSTTNITNTTAHSSGTINHNGARGSIYIEIGTNGSSYPFSLGPYSAPSSTTASIYADWSGLVSGTTYHWRLRYVRVDGTPGTTFTGADQTFTTTGSVGVTPVGHNLALTASSIAHIEATTSDMGAHYTLTPVIDTPGYYFKNWNIVSSPAGVTITDTTNPYVLTMDRTYFASMDLGFYSADLSITAVSSPTSISPADQVTYTLSVKNNGTTSLAPNAEPTAHNVVVTDILPPGMAYVSSSVTGTTCTEASGTVTCNLGIISNGATVPITIVAKPSAGLVGQSVINKAIVSSAASEDLVISNNTATVSTTITAYGIGQVSSAVTGTTAIKGATNISMIQLISLATGTDNMKIEKVTIQDGGTGKAADITLVKLYLDVNGNGVVDAGDTVLASGTFAANNGSLDLTLSTALTVTAGTTPKLLITYDFNTTLASALPFAVFPLAFAGMIAYRRVRRWLVVIVLFLMAVGFSACSSGGGGGDSSVASNQTTTTSTGTPATASTYQVRVTGVTARGATSGNAITIPGLPITGPTITVNK